MVQQASAFTLGFACAVAGDLKLLMVLQSLQQVNREHMSSCSRCRVAQVQLTTTAEDRHVGWQGAAELARPFWHRVGTHMEQQLWLAFVSHNAG